MVAIWSTIFWLPVLWCKTVLGELYLIYQNMLILIAKVTGDFSDSKYLLYSNCQSVWNTLAATGSGKFWQLTSKVVFHCPMRLVLFVCVGVLQLSQPEGVMSSMVTLPNHTFTGQAQSSKCLASIVHILSPKTDNWPSWINRREIMTTENISWSISTKECCQPGGSWALQPPDHHSLTCIQLSHWGPRRWVKTNCQEVQFCSVVKELSTVVLICSQWNLFKRNECIFKGGNSVKIILSPFWEEV